MPFEWSKVGLIPTPDEVEISIFGPGFGECIVVHVGGGRWFIVDSCIDPSDVVDRRPVAERYLRSLGVALETQVDMIVATHWHDDHVMGIARLFDQCTQAKFCCSIALGQAEFSSFVARMSTGAGATDGAKVREFSRVLQVLPGRGPLKYALGSRDLFAWPATAMPHGKRCLLRSFSPSDAEYQLFLRKVVEMMPVAGAPKRSAVADAPNLTSVVLHLELESANILLGADMELHANADRGWNSVIAAAKLSDSSPAAVYKVAHHGSSNGFHEEVWNSMLESAPLCVVTPFNRLPDSRKLPTDADIRRMRERGRLFLTSPPRSPKFRNREAAVVRSLRESSIATRDLAIPIGMVRFRRRVGAGYDWRVEVLGAAKEVISRT